MGKKKANSTNEAPKEPSNPSADPRSIEQLNAGVEKMRLTLGVSPSSSMTAPPSEEHKAQNGGLSADKDDFQRPDMTADEKKNQRAAKAAEKKARAEAAAAKKVAGGGAPVPENNSSTKPTVDKQKQETKKEVTSTSTTKPTEATTRSSLKNNKFDSKSDSKEVKFDLTANTIKSGSEENLAASIHNAAAASAPVEDPAVLAHIHPAFITLAVRCDLGECSELDQLCQEFIEAFREFVSDWSSQRFRDNADVGTAGQDLDLAIRPQLAHLTHDGRWPLPYALGNIVRQLKKEILKIGAPDSQMKARTVADLQDWLTDYSENNFQIAYELISGHLQKKMHSTPSVLTYDWCPIVNSVLLDSFAKGGKQQCTVIDPEMNGRGIRHVKSLVAQGVRCRYADLKSIGYAMKNCSMVLLGCSAVLSNGCVAANRGALQLALTAKAFNIPLLVVTQSFKFVDKVQSYGRMALLSRDCIELVPADLVTAIVTEMRILPPSSAPAVLKAKALDME